MAVGVREGIGVSVAVGRTGGEVNVDEAIGEVVESGGAGFGAQADSKANRRNKMLEGYIRAFLKSPPRTALGACEGTWVSQTFPWFTLIALHRFWCIIGSMTANLYLQDMPFGGVHAFKQPFVIGDGVGKNISTGSTKVVVVLSIDHDLTPQVRDGRDYPGPKSTSPRYFAPVK